MGMAVFAEGLYLAGFAARLKMKARVADSVGKPRIALLSVKMFSELPQNVGYFGILLVELVLKNESATQTFVQFVRWEQPATSPEMATSVEFIEFLGFFPGEVADSGRRRHGSDDRVVNPQEVFKVKIEVKQSIKRWRINDPQSIGMLVLRVDQDEITFPLFHKPVYQRLPSPEDS
jgi:hypothetical protein